MEKALMELQELAGRFIELVKKYQSLDYNTQYEEWREAQKAVCESEPRVHTAFKEYYRSKGWTFCDNFVDVLYRDLQGKLSCTNG